jgi:molybdenum cofactor cytidylyltransferase
MTVMRGRFLIRRFDPSDLAPRRSQRMPDDVLIAILAAGASRRLGRPKQLVEIDGESLLRRQCRVAIDSRIAPVVVICGCHADLCMAEVSDLSVAIRRNEHWEEGIASSIREATLAAMENDAAGLLILHGDQYRIAAQDLRNLYAAFAAAGSSKAHRARHGDYAGPPVILPASLFGELMQLRGDEGARPVLSMLDPDSLRDVEMPNAIHDLDLPAQLSAVNQGSMSRTPASRR